MIGFNVSSVVYFTGFSMFSIFFSSLILSYSVPIVVVGVSLLRKIEFSSFAIAVTSSSLFSIGLMVSFYNFSNPSVYPVILSVKSFILSFCNLRVFA